MSNMLPESVLTFMFLHQLIIGTESYRESEHVDISGAFRTGVDLMALN